MESPYLHRIELAYATRPVQRGKRHTGGMVGGESTGADADEPSPAAPETERKVRDFGHYVPRDLLDVSFPVSVRGSRRRSIRSPSVR